MAKENAGQSGVAGGQSGKSASEKRSIAKQINSQRLDKLDEGSQRAVKVLRRTKGAIDACVEAILDGKRPNPEIVAACANVETYAAQVMLS